MDPIQYVNALRKRWVTVVAFVLLGALAGFLYTAAQPVLYRATSSVFVSSQRGGSTSELVQGTTFTENLVESYAELATLPVVLDPVIEQLGLDVSAKALANSISADIKINTVIIEVTAVSTDRRQAAALANAVTASLATQAPALAPSTDEEGPAIAMKQVAQAQVPSRPFSPNRNLFVTTGILGGLALGVVYALARQLLDTRVRSEEDVQALKELADVPFLGALTRRRGRNRAPIVMYTEPHGIAAEEYRRLCTNLEFAGIDGRISAIAVTSALAGEGKTTTSLNLASAIGERGTRVLLVDADLRRPGVSKYLNIEGAVGLSDVLLGAAHAEDAIQRVGGVDVLPAGTIPPNVTQLVTSSAMARLFGELRERYDFVVVDAPPLLPVTDALTLAKLTDGAVVVAKSRSTRRHQLSQAVRALVQVNARILGVVLNAVDRSEVSAYGYAPTRKGAEREFAAVRPADAPQVFFRSPSVAPEAASEQPTATARRSDDVSPASIAPRSR